MNLTGVWKTIKATVPVLLRQGDGGVVILISSISGLTAELNVGHYAASKQGVTGSCGRFPVNSHRTAYG